MNVAVTGASGFVGRHLLDEFVRSSNFSKVVAISRKRFDDSERLVWAKCSDLASDSHLESALSGVDVVIHVAALPQASSGIDERAQNLLRKANVDAVVNVARQAAAAGVKRFVFISSAKVNGESTTGRAPYTADESPAPVGCYAVSKRDAELSLKELAPLLGIEFVIIRPPLVYGPGVKGNFLSLIKLVKSRIPLPLGAVDNRRSMIFVRNLTAFIVLCASHPNAKNQVFMIGDGEDLSTSNLLRLLASEMGVPSRLVPVPPLALILPLRLIGKREVADRLFGDLAVSLEKARSLLGWAPQYDVKAGIGITVKEVLARDN